MEIKQKQIVPPFTNRGFALLGMHLVATLATVFSMARNWAVLYGAKSNALYAIAYLPMSLSALAAPAALAKLSTKRVALANVCVQLAACAALIFSPLVSGQSAVFISSPAKFYVSLAITILAILASSASSGLAQVAVLSMASKFSPKAVLMHLTGFAAGYLLITTFAMLPAAFIRNLFLSQSVYFALPLFLHTAAFFVFRRLDSAKPAEIDMDRESSKAPAIFESRDFGQVLKEKKAPIAWNFLAFLQTFLAMPVLLAGMTPSNPKMVHCWAFILLLLFLFLEIPARLLATLDSGLMRWMAHEKIIMITCVSRTLLCVLPILTFLAGRGVFYLNPLVADVANVFAFAILGFSHGILGNFLAASAQSGQRKKRGVRSTWALFTAAMALAATLGLLGSVFVANAFPRSYSMARSH